MLGRSLRRKVPQNHNNNNLLLCDFVAIFALSVITWLTTNNYESTFLFVIRRQTCDYFLAPGVSGLVREIQDCVMDVYDNHLNILKDHQLTEQLLMFCEFVDAKLS